MVDYRSRSDNPNYNSQNDPNHPANVRDRLKKENRRQQEDRRSTNRGTPDRRESPSDWRRQHGRGS